MKYERHADSGILAALMADSPLRQPQEIAGMVLFPCSPEASVATGGVYIDGGGKTEH